ncbi:LacI family DNA-binding transcriptional regulator [Streptomyces buecherae]|uniref:LacI family DNA-binding transcriptional regulator n=1 Tax=Streptomyces buecherae TaxID=2763006 RepID=UPI0036D07A65
MFQGTGSRKEHRRRYPAGAAGQRPASVYAPRSRTVASARPRRRAAPHPGERTADRTPGPRLGRRGEPAAARPSKGSDVTTMHDVARHAGVPATTASHVLNATRPARPTPRETVLRAVDTRPPARLPARPTCRATCPDTASPPPSWAGWSTRPCRAPAGFPIRSRARARPASPTPHSARLPGTRRPRPLPADRPYHPSPRTSARPLGGRTPPSRTPLAGAPSP